MTTVIHTWPQGRFIEIKSNLGRRKSQRINKGSNFLGGNFSNRDNVRANLEEKANACIVKDFSSRTELSIFRLIVPVLLDWSKEKTSHVFPAEKSLPAPVNSVL